MKTEITPLSKQTFTAPYRKLRERMMKTYGVSAHQTDERTATSRRTCSMIAGRSTSLKYIRVLAREVPMERLRDYLFALPGRAIELRVHVSDISLYSRGASHA